MEAFMGAPIGTKLVGRGIHSSTSINEVLYGNTVLPGVDVLGPHNSYLYLLNEFGLLGFLVYLLFILGVIRYVYRSVLHLDRRTAGGQWKARYLTAFLSFFITYHLTTEMFGWNIPTFGGRVYFLVYTGVALAISSRALSPDLSPQEGLKA